MVSLLVNKAFKEDFFLADRSGWLRKWQTQIVTYILYKFLLVFQRAFQTPSMMREPHWTEWAKVPRVGNCGKENSVSRGIEMRINLSESSYVTNFPKTICARHLFKKTYPQSPPTGFQSLLKSDLFIIFLALFIHYFFNSTHNYWVPISCLALF